MADPHPSLVDLKSSQPLHDSPTLQQQFQPLLESLQNLLRLLPPPDGNNDLTPTAPTSSETLPHARHDLTYTSTLFPEASQATPCPTDAAPSFAANLEVAAQAPNSITASTGKSHLVVCNPDLDPHFSLLVSSNLTSHGVKNSSNVIFENKFMHDLDSSKKSFASVLCAASNGLSDMVVEAPKMVGGTPLVEKRNTLARSPSVRQIY